jgi:hypothetical protein
MSDLGVVISSLVIDSAFSVFKAELPESDRSAFFRHDSRLQAEVFKEQTKRGNIFFMCCDLYQTCINVNDTKTKKPALVVILGGLLEGNYYFRNSSRI